ncbi:MAG TPA: hypothetical protein VFC65_04005 [Prolixibacteraceae bacterium]|nr:hypothetical protein [Prolixibacteraceae bacterium]
MYLVKKYILLFVAVGLITMVSCTPAKKESKPVQVQQQNQQPQTIAIPAASATIIRTGGAPTLENAARQNTPQANNPSSPTAPTVANAIGTPPKLNPPHGQPFHKCEIAVGSPLKVLSH